MIFATGIDIIEIERVEKAVERSGQKFIERIFTDAEIEYCSNKKHPIQHYAARFAVKEAVYKALKPPRGTPLRWREIEVTHVDKVQPEVKLSGHTKSMSEQIGITKISISQSHSIKFAAAVAIAEY
jgi:holo-[acyl-carrier protein] synthase